MKRQIVALLCAVLGLPFALGGCPIPLEPVQQTKLLDIEDDGVTVTGNQGDILLIVLPANHTTNYVWVAKDAAHNDYDQPIVGYMQEWYVPPQVGGITGQGGVSVIEFQFGWAGTTQLTLELRASGAPASDPPAETFSVTVTSMG